MKNSPTKIDRLSQEINNLKLELIQTQEKFKVAEETLQAIQTGEVDALVMMTEEGRRIFTLQGADYIYQRLVEQMGEGAATLSDEGLILYCNQKLSDLLKYPLKNLIGSTLESFISVKDQKAFTLLLQKIKKDENLSIELSLLNTENSIEIPVKLSITQLEIDNFTVNSVVITDITESKVKEATKLNQVLNKAIATITRYRVFLDRTWIIDYWSEGCELLLGYTSTELIAHQNLWRDNIHPDDLEYFSQQAFDDNHRQKTIDVEYRFRHKDGNYRWITSSQIFEWDDINNCWLVTAILLDITKRKQEEKALFESEQKLKVLLEYSPAVIFMLDLENKVTLVSRAYEELIGISADKLLGKSIYDIWTKEQADEFTKVNRQVIENKTILTVEEVLPQPDGHTYLTIKFPLYDAEGQVNGIGGISTDINEKKQLEKQFYHIQRLESLGTLASGIAHDFNNILTPILGVSQMLPMKFPNVDEQTQRLFTLLTNSSKRAINLVKQILSFSRVEEGQYSVLQINDILSDIINVAEQTFPKSIEISTDIPKDKLWHIWADPTQLHQVLMNLMINARDAMKSGGILTISAENRVFKPTESNLPKISTKGLNPSLSEANMTNQSPNNNTETNNHYVSISIADTGVGIPPELLERIFEPFFTTKEVGKGTGLGLSSVTGIVKNHGGFIDVYSELGNGAKFTVFLPAIEKQITTAITEKEIRGGNGELILIVDDEKAIQEIVKTALENLNYRTLIASDAREALSIYGEQPQEIMVILLDMMMPHFSGTDAIKALRKINPEVKIIASSGLITNRKLAKQAGVDTFLLKPYSIEQLLETITQLIFTDREKSIKTISSASPRLSNKEILQTSLGKMPLPWLEKMYDASYCVDADVMLELIEEIPPEEMTLSNALKDLVNDFNIDLIMELTEAEILNSSLFPNPPY